MVEKREQELLHWKDKVSAFYAVCKTLNVQPTSFLISIAETEKLLEKFKEIFLAGKAQYSYIGAKQSKSGQDTSIARYVSAVANFLFQKRKTNP